MQNNKGIEINRRFFMALDILISTKRIDSAHSFCEKNDYLPTNLSRLRSDPWREFPLHLLTALVDDHRISGDWLLTGTGSMQRKRSAIPI